MKRRYSILLASLALSGSAALAQEGAIEFDLGGNFFSGSVVTDLGEGTAGAANAGADILAIEWSGLSLITFNNIGIPNYGSEAMIGITAVNSQGDAETYFVFPFPNANYQGTPSAPITQAGPERLDISSLGLTLDVNGSIDALLRSAFDDQSGSPAGEWQGGTVRVIYEAIPAPGALALIGLAGLLTRGRRRR